MKKVLYILGLLDDRDIDWLARAGSARTLSPGTVLVEEGGAFDELYIVLEGRLGISIRGRQVAEVGQGEVVGEISLLDSRPPSATATATVETLVLGIPMEQLNRQLDNDPGFAGRFFRALGVFMAQRLRQSNLLNAMGGTDGSLEDDEEMLDEIDPEVLEQITLAGHRFRMIVDRLRGG